MILSKWIMEATNVIMAMLELKRCIPRTSSGIKRRLDCLYNFIFSTFAY